MTEAGGATSPEEMLIDSRCGLIRKVVRNRPVIGFPCAYGAYTAFVSHTARFAPWSADVYTYGSALDDDVRARRAAVGEAVERYCGNAVPGDLLKGSYDRLVRLGAPVVDPQEFVLYSRRQYAAAGFPFVPLTRDLEISWVLGRDVGSEQEALLPASLVYLNFFGGDHQTESATNSPIYAGIAAGESEAHAEQFAIQEMFERDAMAIWWLSGSSSVAIDASDQPALTALLKSMKARQLIVSLFQIRSSFDVSVVGAFVEDTARSLVALGTACRALPLDATRKALTEVLDVLSLSVAILDPDGLLAHAIALGDPHFRPHRADRQYLDDFRPDWRDVTDLPAHAQLYLDPRMQGESLDRLRRQEEEVVLDALPAVHGTDVMSSYVDRIEAAGMRVYAVDLTTSDVGSSGLRVARVVVPGFYTNAPAAFPFLGGTRLYREPVRRGWTLEPVTEENLELHPIPHT